jgi:Domain of unknown function (DUF5104)
MQHITAAVNHHSATELKELFSRTARDKATDLDSGIRNFLTFFPSAFKDLGEPSGGPNETDQNDDGKRTVELFSDYKVLANGKTYDVFFADFSVDQGGDPNDLGLYALGVAPWNGSSFTHPTAASKAFDAWTSQFDMVDHTPTGTPGVYVYSQKQ